MAERKRNYRKEYDTYQGTPAQIKARASRNAARAAEVKKGTVRKGDGMEVDHKNGNPMDNRPSNRQVLTRTANRKKGR